jgi:hypothetical protein
VIKDLQKALQPIEEEFSPEEAKKEGGRGLPDLPKDTAVNPIIRNSQTLYACWTTTVATTVPPSEQ